jgi:O-antigen ligase
VVRGNYVNSTLREHSRDGRAGPADGGGYVRRFSGYAHNEYLQVAAEIGLVGLVLLAVLLVALASLLWGARATSGWARAWPRVNASYPGSKI